MENDESNCEIDELLENTPGVLEPRMNNSLKFETGVFFSYFHIVENSSLRVTTRSVEKCSMYRKILNLPLFFYFFFFVALEKVVKDILEKINVNF